jgi:hypothetical protein
MFLIGVLSVSTGFAQLEPSGENLELPGFFDNFSIGGLSGISLFHGDLANYYLFPKKEDRVNAINYGYKLFAEKDIWQGLGGRIMFSKGRLGGGAQKGMQSHYMNFRGDYFDITLQGKFRLSDYIFRQASASRFFIHGYVGYGIIGFRSLEWYRDTGLVRNYVGYEEAAESGLNYTKILENKSKRKVKQVFPVGIKFGYQISSKADLIFEYSLNNARTDQLDTWVREWTADDKYGFIGLGIQITFNRDNEVLEPLFKKKDKLAKTSKVKSGDAPSNQEMLDAALKILEIQLKLFEMNYLEKDGE